MYVACDLQRLPNFQSDSLDLFMAVKHISVLEEKVNVLSSQHITTLEDKLTALMLTGSHSVQF